MRLVIHRAVLSVCAWVALSLAACGSEEQPGLEASTTSSDSSSSGSTTSSSSGSGGNGGHACTPVSYAPDLAFMLPTDGIGLRDVFIDADGNLYLAGDIFDPSFPITHGTFVGGPNGRGDVV